MKPFAANQRFRDLSDLVVATFGAADDGVAVFNVPVPTHDYLLKVIASATDRWDHVSASLPDRCPSWDEMDLVYRLFFRPEETAMQLHVPDLEHVDCHPFALHLWRPQRSLVPKPPARLVGALPGWKPGRRTSLSIGASA